MRARVTHVSYPKGRYVVKIREGTNQATVVLTVFHLRLLKEERKMLYNVTN